MDQNTPLKISHDVGQGLQRKLEGLSDVERAFVHIDYEHEHDTSEGICHLALRPAEKRLFSSSAQLFPSRRLDMSGFRGSWTDDIIFPEHKPLYEAKKPRRSLKQIFLSFRHDNKDAAGESETTSGGVLSNRSSGNA